MVLHGVNELPGACATIANSPLPAHSEVATDALRKSITARELDRVAPAARVHVYRRGGRLSAELVDVPPEAPRGALATRVTGALRAFDPYAEGIDVVTTQPVADPEKMLGYGGGAGAGGGGSTGVVDGGGAAGGGGGGASGGGGGAVPMNVFFGRMS